MDKTTRRVYAHKTGLGLGMGGLDEVEDQEGRDTCRVQGLTKVLGPQAGIGGSQRFEAYWNSRQGKGATSELLQRKEGNARYAESMGENSEFESAITSRRGGLEG